MESFHRTTRPTCAVDQDDLRVGQVYSPSNPKDQIRLPFTVIPAESGNPVYVDKPWMPAFAGKTNKHHPIGEKCFVEFPCLAEDLGSKHHQHFLIQG